MGKLFFGEGLLHLAQGVLGGDHAEGVAAAEGQAGLVERIVRAAVERAAQVADGIQAFDDLAVRGQRLRILPESIELTRMCLRRPQNGACLMGFMYFEGLPKSTSSPFSQSSL